LTTPSTSKASENETYSVSREGDGDEAWAAVWRGGRRVCDIFDNTLDLEFIRE